MNGTLRHIGLSLGPVQHWNDGLGEFSRRLVEALAAQAPQLRERERIALHLHLPRRWHGLFGPDVGYLDTAGHQRWWHPQPLHFALWHRLHQHIRLRPPAGAQRRLETVHDLNFLFDKGQRTQARYRRRLRRRLAGATAVAITRHVAGDLAREVAVQAEVVHNGATDLSLLAAEPVPQAEGAPFLLHLSRMAPSKNVDALLGLAAVWPGQRMLLVGPRSSYTEQVRSRIQAQQLHNVQLLLDVSDAQKAWLYRHCSGFLFPSHTEGFGLPPVEAMMFGRAVFLSRCTSLPEVGGDAAIYFDSFDPRAMRQTVQQGLALHDDARAARVRQWALRYQWPVCAAAYLALYRRLLAA